MRAAPRTPEFKPAAKVAKNIDSGNMLPAIKKWYGRAKKFDITMSDVIVKQRGHQERINFYRRVVLNQLMPAMLSLHDLLTGYLPASCITTLSDQLNITTTGQAEYKNGKKVEKGGKKKKSISRMSRAIAMMQAYGLIEIEHITDPTTGTYLPSLIKLTDRFYAALGITDKELENAKRQRIGYLNLNKKYGNDNALTFESLPELARRKQRELRKERQEFRRDLRIKRRVSAMSNAELHQTAQKIVNAAHCQEELNDMSDAHYSRLVEHEKRSILNRAYSPPTSH
ncbi:plasmid replication initiator RepA [Neptunicella sp. SCSIO 80796]|uniref:plasmid replication initiator RepA n=1 Tax=Neptunicella plasticusilytica TaxID=3117012 RepID=UPI003A4DAB99